MAEWWRSWHGGPTDAKWLVIARKAKVLPGTVSAIAWALFDHASQCEDRGDVSTFDVETYAAFSGYEEDEIQSVISVMEEKNVIENGRLANWEKRQPKREDNSAERAKQWRERKRTHANANEHREEQRREEKNREDKKETHSAGSDKSLTAGGDNPEFELLVEKDADPPLITIPLIDGSEFPVDEKTANAFAECYPAVDIVKVLREVRAWNLSNPKHRKTRSGVMKHINHFMGKAQDRAAYAGSGRVYQQPQTKAETLRERNAESSRRLLESIGEGGYE